MKMNGIDFDTYFKNYPDKDGFFGKYGGCYISDELKNAMAEITEAYYTIAKSRKFIDELRRIRKEFQGRPTPISHLERLSNSIGNVQLYVKREDLNHTGAHKLNHCMGEALLAKYMGKKKIIAETGAGQHGVALATAAAYFGLECDIYMGSVDIKKQAPNVARMKILGANVVEVTHGLATLKEAVDAAFEAYAREYKDCIYCIGSVLGPHPFPMMVREFQKVVGIEAREKQFLQDIIEQVQDDETVNMLGICYLEEENYNEALGLFFKLIKSYPDNHILLTNLAKCEYKCNKKEEALEHIRRALMIFDDYKEALELLEEINNG